MRTRLPLQFAALAALSLCIAGATSPDDPKPPVVTPGDNACVVPAPSDAVVLFDGTTLDQWTGMDGKPAQWITTGKKGDPMTIAPGKGNIITKPLFSDAQFHVEFREPTPAAGEGQERGNSGVYMQSRYEVQVLDSFKSDTYTNGQCGAIYSLHPPLVNACRPPGQWQTYDIIFHAARWDGKVRTAPARFTVLHNGVLIQDEASATNPTTAAADNNEAPGDGPLMLQDHGCLVQYRNIWVRPLK